MFVLFILFGILLPDFYLERQCASWLKKYNWVKWMLRLVPLFYIGATIRLYFEVGQAKDIKLAIGFLCFVWSWFFIYVPKLLFMLISALQYPIRRFYKKETKLFHILGILAAFYALYFYANGAFYGRYNYQVNHISLCSDKLPKAFDGTKVIQLSDIHIGNLDSKDQILSEMTRLVNAERADYILHTGDLVNNYAGEIGDNSRFFKDLMAVKGKYSVLGNHDYGDYMRWEKPEMKEENLQQLFEKQKEMGFTMLNNESVILREDQDSIALIGVENWGEPPFPQHGDLKTAMQGVEEVPFKILMTHNPIHWDKEVKNQTDIFLSLSGHTHAMQMVFDVLGFKFSPAMVRYPKWLGLYEENGQYLYVNAGIGYVLIPFRYQCGPEITVFELCCSASKNE